jgi:hypothetical protein
MEMAATKIKYLKIGQLITFIEASEEREKSRVK